MTTRCTVKITNAAGADLYLYRHTDGYPAVTGADVYRAVVLALHARDLRSSDPAIPAINHLLTRISPANHHRAAVPLYEPIDSPPGDIEHYYHIDCCVDYVFLNYAAGHGAQLERETKPYAPCQFRHLINDQRHILNLALIALAAVDPYYAQHSPFPDLP